MRAELAHVFPSLTALATEREVALQHERYRSHRAVRELLELLARRSRSCSCSTTCTGPTRRRSSCSARCCAGRRPRAVLIALAVRPRQVPERLAGRARARARAGALIRVELGALDADEARELLGDAVDAADATALYEESGGNPFYLEQLARRSTARSGRRSHAEMSAGGDRGPAAVAAALTEELALLSDAGTPRARRRGRGGRPVRARAGRGRGRHARRRRRWTRVDELLRLDLVRATDVPRRFRFRHPLVRRAVYEATAGGWRLGAHERCAEALAARGAPAAARAHHVERSAREGDVDAVAVLREAGEAAARLAPASAARWFGAALRLLPRERAGGGARRAPPRPCGGADGDRPVRRQPRGAARGARARARRLAGAAREGRPRCAGGGEPSRPPRAGRRPPRERARRPAGPGLAEAVALMIELAMNLSGARSTTRCTSGPNER